ncbi:complex I subunit 4 family protein [Paludifilum halophilum]|uniref:NADH-quinone oxidoreductase subunit M n=1 Tax=Paludifilum halophilum TaxID=1642702 RepID=A0A235B6U3_9BACL|nr:NADH-quinone oxidoreductase subunit M [Paludifilum halophilum]OYD08023.1 NADH-quinone oxidoreductase subunit M [Paludifilum halophilum]
MDSLIKILPTWIAFSPLLGFFCLLWVPRNRSGWVKGVGMLSTLPPLLLSLFLYQRFDFASREVQFSHTFDWFHIPLPQGQTWSFSYSMGVDGLSMPLVVMTAVIATLAATASMYVKKRTKGYFLLFTLLEVGMLGVFMARNLLLFFLFFEVTLVATFFLIGIWGLVHREKAANQFLLYNGLGSAFMLIAFIGIMVLFQTLDFSRLQMVLNNPQTQMALASQPQFQTLIWGIFIALVIAFGIKLPIFPFHTWMLKVHAEAPPSVVMIHAGVLLKMGAYGLIRFGVELFPSQLREAAVVLAVLGLINILYGAVLAFVQQDLRRVLAYASVSHMGIILFGIASLNVEGLSGAVFQAVSHGFISALMFFFIGSLYERTRTTRIEELGGLARSMPVLSGVFLAGGLALLGLPGMSGFVAEFLAFLGLFQTQPILAACGAIGLILAAIYTLRAVLGTTFGPDRGTWSGPADIRTYEAAPMFILLALIVLVGVYPGVLGDPMQTTLQLIVSRIGG